MKILKRICVFLATFGCAIFLISSLHPKATWNGQPKPYTKVSTDMRAVWVATVGNLNIEPQLGTSQDAINNWKKNYIKILDDAEANHLNTIVFQVRPCNDAFYPSKYNPWSKYLAGYGVDPGWDPLSWMIEETHKRGLEYHAWLNPYRASTDTTASIIEGGKIKDVDVDELNEYKDTYFGRLKQDSPDTINPVFEEGSALHHNVVLGAEDLFVLNPASQKVRDHITNTILEIVDNYDIDGIHFDDYFYPSTTSYGGTNSLYKGYTFPIEPWVDMADYLEYKKTASSPLSIYDWRRENVNILIKTLGEEIRQKNQYKQTKCAFGISPAARWAPTIEACTPGGVERGAEGGMSGSCYNYYSYSDLYADTLKWAKENWIDYITPQIYTNLKKDYDEIVKWWNDALVNSKTTLYVGTALYMCKSGWGNGLTEIYYQILYNSEFIQNVKGYFLFSYDSLISQNGKSAMNPVVTAAWKYNALTPTYPAYEYEMKLTSSAKPENLEIKDDVVTFDLNSNENAKGVAVYEIANTIDNYQDELIPSNIVALEINPNKEISFKRKAGFNYFLATFDQDNSIHQDVVKLELDNELPRVTVSTNKDEYIYNEDILIDVEITDDDSESFYISIAYSSNGTSFSNYIVEKEKLDGKSYHTSFKAPSFSTSNGGILVEVRDLSGAVKTIKKITIKSAPPTVVIEKILDTEVFSILSVKVTLLDDVSSTLSYKAYISVDGADYLEVSSEMVRVGDTEIFINCDTPAQKCIIKIEAIDTDGNKTTAYSNEFKIIDDEPVEPDPTPTPVNPDTKPSTDIKKGCSCKKSLNQAISSIIILAGLVILFRKEK